MKTPKKPKPQRAVKPDSHGRDTPAEASSDSDALQGEGNYTAARRYDQSATDFANSGRVDEAARRARPGSSDEERALEAAEEQGRSHAKDEDPSVAQRHDR